MQECVWLIKNLDTEMEILSRKEAKEQRLKLYFTGIQCPNGHVSERYTSTSNCLACHAEYYVSIEQKEKQQEYRERNKEKKADYDRQFDKNNKAYRAALKSANRAKRKFRVVEWDKEFTEFVCEESYHLAQLRENVTGFKWHLDHIVPLCGTTVSGLHVWNNFAVIPAKQNLRKKNHYVAE